MNGFDLSTISGIFVGGTEYSAIYKGSSLIWQKQSGPVSYDRQYLTIESLEDNNDIGIFAYSASYTVTIQYSTNKTTWTSVTSSTSTQRIIILNRGDKVYLRGNINGTASTSSYYNRFTSTKTFNVYGNVASLLNSSSFEDIISYNQTWIFTRLFFSTNVVDASNLVLPATTLAEGCYSGMFMDCTSLTAPPALPATTLAENCYSNMFNGCTLLTTAPELPAITLANRCYMSIFRSCSKLNYIKMLATNISATSCLLNWVNGVSGSGTFVKNINATWTTTGVSGIPSGWTVQTIDPSVSDNASITLYDNYEKGDKTQYNKIHTLTTGNNYTAYGSDTNAWYYQKGKYIAIGTNYSYMSTQTTFKMNLVITGLTEFKLYLYNSTNVQLSVLNKINDNTKLAWGDYSSSNTHVQVYVNSGGKEYTYNNLNPNSKYTIAINSKCGPSSSLDTKIIIPSTYPSVSIQYAYFNQSTDYTEIYG